MKYLPTALFTGFAGKLLYLGVGTGWDALILIGLGIISYKHQYYTNNKKIKELEELITSENTEMKSRLDEHDTMIKETVTSVASVKLGAGMRSRRVGNE